MSIKKLVAEIRNDQGRGASRRARHSGLVPAIIYGANKPPVTVTLDHNIIVHALKKEIFHTSILDLEIDGKSEKVILRDFQMHPFRDQVLHLDLQRIVATEEINLHIPLHFLNADISPAVKMQSAHITHLVNEVEIRALASNIPPFIDVNLAELKAGQTLHLSDLVLPTGVKLEKLLRGDDSAIVIAGGIAEVSDVEIVSPADIPAIKGSAEDNKD